MSITWRTMAVMQRAVPLGSTASKPNQLRASPGLFSELPKEPSKEENLRKPVHAPWGSSMLPSSARFYPQQTQPSELCPLHSPGLSSSCSKP